MIHPWLGSEKVFDLNTNITPHSLLLLPMSVQSSSIGISVVDGEPCYADPHNDMPPKPQTQFICYRIEIAADADDV